MRGYLATMSVQGVRRMNGPLVGTVFLSLLVGVLANLLTPVIRRRLSQWTNNFANARALRSKRQTEKRLHKLQQQLAYAHNREEDLSPYARLMWLAAFYILLSLCVCAGALVVTAGLFAYSLLKMDDRTRYVVEAFSALAALFAIVGARTANMVITELQSTQPASIKQLEASIAELQAHLNAP